MRGHSGYSNIMEALRATLARRTMSGVKSERSCRRRSDTVQEALRVWAPGESRLCDHAYR